MICSHQYPPWVMNGPKATSALSPFDSQLRTLVGADHWQCRLLRARRERPCNCRAAEQRDELAPFHSITSSVRALLHWTKFLHAAPKADLRGVEGALRINRNVVHPLELAGLAPLAAPLREQLSILARKRVDLAIGAVGDEDELLLRIDRQHQVPDRAVGERLGFDPEFLHKGAILAKHLDAVVDTIADIDEPVVR